MVLLRKSAYKACIQLMITCMYDCIVSRPIRHSLPQDRLQPLFGSQMNGRCTSVSGLCGNICNGTSVLNDGIIPALSGVSDDSCLPWAAQLLTMGRSYNRTAGVVLSLEVEPINHDRVELVVFNCPERGIYTPEVNIYVDTSFRPIIGANIPGHLNTNQSLPSTSCDHLIKFCVELAGAVSTPFFNLQFPYQNNSNLVFLGEVTFLDGGADPCNPPELITMPVTKLPLPSGVHPYIHPYIHMY